MYFTLVKRQYIFLAYLIPRYHTKDIEQMFNNLPQANFSSNGLFQEFHKVAPKTGVTRLRPSNQHFYGIINILLQNYQYIFFYEYELSMNCIYFLIKTRYKIKLQKLRITILWHKIVVPLLSNSLVQIFHFVLISSKLA